MSERKRLVVALDVESGAEALRLVRLLEQSAGMFKIGKQLFTAEGPSLVREIVGAGHRVFLDLKYHDIPATVAKACVEAARLGVAIVNLHAVGGSEMMREARARVDEACADEALVRPRLLAVTVLTSLDDTLLAEVGVPGGAAAQVVRLARLAHACGMDGVVASPREIKLVREAVRDPLFVVLTPGIRPSGGAADDQRRTMTPGEAVASGADLIVVGRPITAAADPVAAAAAIVAEMEAAMLDTA